MKNALPALPFVLLALFGAAAATAAATSPPLRSAAVTYGSEERL